MSARIAVFPGSLPLFDRIVMAMGVNTTKKYMFTQEQRLKWVQDTFVGHKQVDVMAFEGLTADLCKRLHAKYIVRGLRNSTDHGNERSIALMNHALAKVETIFLPSLPEHAHISSTIVRELIANKADVSAFVPGAVRP